MSDWNAAKAIVRHVCPGEHDGISGGEAIKRVVAITAAMRDWTITPFVPEHLSAIAPALWLAHPKPAAFSPGDVVRLKSGGPLMTVGKVDGNRVEACWYTGAPCHPIADSAFPVAALVAALVAA